VTWIPTGFVNAQGQRGDATLGFNEALGFRAGEAAPYHPWDAGGRAPLTLIELPLSAMDGVLFIDRISRLKRNLYVGRRKKLLQEEGERWTTAGERPPVPIGTRLRAIGTKL
jgi:hypothetical protein